MFSQDGTVTRHLGGTLYEVFISKQNRHELFSAHVEALNQSDQETQLILSNLERLSPSLSPSFGARTADQISRTPFKVIVESDIGPVPINEEQPLRQYLAVSYSWRYNDGVWPSDGSTPYSPWPFSKPFVDAVLNERGVAAHDAADRSPHYRREAIWVDQMCIDQNNEDEKRDSIAMMDFIYKRCRKLMIILEDVVLTTTEVQALSKYGLEQVQLGQRSQIDEEDIVNLGRVLGKIENSRLWSRSWCWHEFEVNEPWSDHRHSYYQHCAVFVTKAPDNGTCKIEWLLLLWLRGTTDPLPAVEQGILPAPTAMEQLRRDVRWTIADNRSSRYRDAARRGPGASRSSIMARFNVASLSECSILSDLVSITINLSGLGLHFRGTVANRDELFFTIATLALAAGEASPLTYMQDPMLLLDGSSSWLPRPPQVLDMSIHSFEINSIRGLHSITPKAIEMDMVFFESPAQIPSNEGVQSTYEIFPESPIRHRAPKYALGNRTWSNLYDDEADDSRRRSFLALACQSGLEFIKRLWRQLDRDVIQASYNQIIFEPFTIDNTLRPAAERLYATLSKGADTAREPAPAAAAASRNADIHTLHLFLTWLTDPRSMYYISALSLRIPAAPHAIISNIVLRADTTIKSEENNLRFAVPIDLLNITCQVLRCWIVQPFEQRDGMHADSAGVRKFETDRDEGAGLWESTTRKWRIVGKALLLGEDREGLVKLSMDAGRDDDDGSMSGGGDGKCSNVSFRRRQVVVG